MDIDLLQHSTYDVEQIKKNREFYSAFINKLRNTYSLFNFSESDKMNEKRTKFAPSVNRINNVFISMDLNGVIGISINIGLTNNDKIQHLIDKYLFTDYSASGKTITIKGITHENYNKYLKDIVTCIEYADYSFK
jgi:hypothetical protein